MRLSDQRPGSRILFVDSFTQEILLEVVADEGGASLIGFALYDSKGAPVARSDCPEAMPPGFCVRAADNEVLLAISDDPIAWLSYRLYSHEGVLLTESDGQKTVIHGGLKMDGKGRVNPRAVKTEDSDRTTTVA